MFFVRLQCLAVSFCLYRRKIHIVGVVYNFGNPRYFKQSVQACLLWYGFDPLFDMRQDKRNLQNYLPRSTSRFSSPKLLARSVSPSNKVKIV